MKRLIVALLLLSTGCAQCMRDCDRDISTTFGADYVLVAVNAFGVPYRCWELDDVVITNEGASDGVWWQDRASGSLIHIAGEYNYIQVERNNWAEAYHHLGVTKQACKQIQETMYDPQFPTSNANVKIFKLDGVQIEGAKQ